MLAYFLPMRGFCSSPFVASAQLVWLEPGRLDGMQGKLRLYYLACIILLYYIIYAYNFNAIIYYLPLFIMNTRLPLRFTTNGYYK